MRLAHRVVPSACLALVAALCMPALSARADGPPFIGAWGTAGMAPGQFYFPHHFAVSPAGTVCIGQHLSNRVQWFTTTGTFILWRGLAQADGVAVAPDGTFYVTGANLVAHYSAAGRLLDTFGETGSGNGQLNQPADLAVNAAGEIYVADAGNARIQKFSSAGGYLGQWGNRGTGDGQFQSPFGLLIDAAGNVWVVDIEASRLQKFTSTGTFLFAFGTVGTGPGEWSGPGRPCLDLEGNLIVPDRGNHRMQVYTQAGVFLFQWGELGTGPSQFNHPIGVAIDAAGTLYVLDTDNGRVQMFASVPIAARATSWGRLKSLHR